jgi:uncharacterized protein
MVGFNLKSLAVATIVSLTAVTSASAAMYKFSGGPSGGTFQYFAAGISQYTNDNKIIKSKINVSASAGSVQNVRLVSAKRADFGIAYAGDAYLASVGKLSPKDTRQYKGVTAVAYLYGAPAQLIVKANSNINSAADLAGKKVGVGKGGSGAAANAERFFKGMGVWDKMKPEFLGYNNASAAFSNNQLDAFWVFAGYPTAAVIQAAQQNNIKLIDVYKDAKENGVLKQYPFYSPLSIPANTYKGQTNEINSFQDSALWIANERVPEDVVYNMLKAVFTEKGLEYMITIKKTAKQMSVKGGTKGTSELKLHPGAIKFWKEKGVL